MYVPDLCLVRKCSEWAGASSPDSMRSPHPRCREREAETGSASFRRGLHPNGEDQTVGHRARGHALSGILSRQPTSMWSGSVMRGFAATICETVNRPKSRSLRTIPDSVSPGSTR
jgi:hypothetical protein